LAEVTGLALKRSIQDSRKLEIVEDILLPSDPVPPDRYDILGIRQLKLEKSENQAFCSTAGFKRKLGYLLKEVGRFS
jgi:hypothetical protein